MENRFEVIVLDKEKEVVKYAAELVCSEIKKNPDLVLCLPTGKTYIPIYKELVAKYRKGLVDFSKVIALNLDEYVRLRPDHKDSFGFYLRKNFFNKINIDKENIHLFNGHSKNLKKECLKKSELIKDIGIGLCLLGIGRNGHIGFNEPGSSFESRARVVELSEGTRRVNFGDAVNSPGEALTIGISEILSSKKIVLIANGSEKSEAVRKMIDGKVSEKVPASILQRHDNTKIILDRKAASKLKR